MLNVNVCNCNISAISPTVIGVIDQLSKRFGAPTSWISHGQGPLQASIVLPLLQTSPARPAWSTVNMK